MVIAFTQYHDFSQIYSLEALKAGDRAEPLSVACPVNQHPDLAIRLRRTIEHLLAGHCRPENYWC
jgi:hypothetical protein